LVVITRFIFISIGLNKGLKPNKKPMVPIPLIEKFWKKNSKDILRDEKQIIGLAKQLDWSKRQVERWIRRRQKKHTHSGLSSCLPNKLHNKIGPLKTSCFPFILLFQLIELDKFAECGWKVCYFSFATFTGIAYLFNKVLCCNCKIVQWSFIYLSIIPLYYLLY